METWKKRIPKNEIADRITSVTVDFAEEFGKYLAKDETSSDSKTGKERPSKTKLTTNQLRKFFGEVKRQQQKGYDSTEFVLLKPKLAYAVGRVQGKTPCKIEDFYNILTDAMTYVTDEKSFTNFIRFFEAIVAYHKANVKE